MKLSLENLDVTSFRTTRAPAAPSALATAGEDCFSAPWVCPPKTITWAAAE
ncbi:MAG TPA: hypothetical protein VFJ82_16555 [Longimicrobium sp.]|nr:hypothetical protein [Longimicrobium sp.]